MNIKIRLIKFKSQDNMEYLGVDMMIILKLTLQKYFMDMWTRFSWLRIGAGLVNSHVA